MKHAKMSPRMQVAGFEPACINSGCRKLALPKPIPVPGTMAMNEQALSFQCGELTPPDRTALSQIAETADLIEAANRQWLLVPADAWLLDCLATFESEIADLELETDDDRDNDNAFDRSGAGFAVTDDYEPNLGQ